MSIIYKAIDNKVVVFLTVFIFGMIYFLKFGLIMSPDSNTYSNWADSLINCKFNTVIFLKSNSFIIPPFFYLGFITLAALCKLFFLSYWAKAIIILNITSFSLVGVMFTELIKRVCENKQLRIITLIFYIACFDIINWTRYVLSDSTFLILVFGIFFLCFSIYEDRKKHFIKKTAYIAILLSLSIFYRPTGIVLIPITAAVFTYIFISDLKSDKRVTYLKVFYFILILFIIILIILQTLIVSRTTAWPVKIASGYIKFVANAYSHGEVVSGRKETFHNIPSLFMDYLSITGDRFLHYFCILSKGYSMFHNLMNFIYYTPVYIGAFFGIYSIKGEQKGTKSERVKAAVVFSFIFILAYGVLQAMTEIDYDWRYRLPILPIILFVSAIGIDRIITKARMRTK